MEEEKAWGLTPQGADALNSNMADMEPEEALLLRFIWSREMMELDPPTEQELTNLIKLYQRACADKMLCDMLIRGELLVNSIEGQSDDFEWQASEKGRQRFARELGEGYDA